MANRTKLKATGTGARIRELRINKGLTQKELAEKLFKSESAIRMWELGKSEPDLQSVNALAVILGVSPSVITGWKGPTITGIAHPGEILDQVPDGMLESAEAMYVDPDSPLALLHKKAKKKPYLAPVLGYVAAGIPIEAITDIIDYEELDPEMVKDGATYFCLQIKGASMEPRFAEGDVVVVRQQPDVDSGQIAIVCINGDHATCKKVMKHSNGILLQPLNPAYEPTFYTAEEIASIPVTILGRVVELRAKF